jgi:neutral ceramidase
VLWQGPRVCTIAAPVSLLYHLFKQYFGVGYHCGFNHSPCSFCSYPDEFESTRIIGERQFKKAVELFNKATEQLKGKVGYRHAYLNFSNLEVAQGNDVVKTCPAAMGFAFAAGTTDGPGAFDFKQGDDKASIKNILFYPVSIVFEKVIP